MRTAVILFCLATGLMYFSGATAAERLAAKVACTPAKVRLVYDCLITLSGKKSGQRIEGVQIVVGADMPSMAMAHNVRPVRAVPTGKPGVYKFRLALEMRGLWALKIKVSGARRDLIVRRFRFGRGPRAHHRHCRTGRPSPANHRNPRMVALGRRIYIKNCSVCHGKRLQGEARFRRSDPDGYLKAPPLDGSGHSAHHADREMFRAVRDGPGAIRGRSKNYRTKMPAFRGALTEAEIWSVLAYIKSRWTARVRRRHARCFGGRK